MAFVFVVTQGIDLGERFAVEAARTYVLGRARDCDFLVSDPSVSRRHVAVRAEGASLLVQCLPGAPPFFVDTIARSEARLAVGQKVVLGNSVLAVGVEASPATADSAALTEARRYIAGPAAEVRGLSDVYALIDALDAVDDRVGVEAVFERWASAQLEAKRTAWTRDIVEDAPTVERASEEPGRRWLDLTLSTASLRVGLEFLARNGALDAGLVRTASVGARLLAAALARAELTRSLDDDRRALRKQAIGSATAFLGDSPSAAHVAALIPKLSASDSTVLLLGDSGVGKTFVARLIHEASRRARSPLRVVNCAAIPDTLVESELFGHERGAFTGADAQRAGAFESAGAGTILLDEIGELPLSSQAKLLRVLEDRAFERVGSNRPLPLRARVIAATNRDLKGAIAAGQFRSDLFFRVSVVSVRIPSLAERGADLVLLAKRLLADLAESTGRRVVGFSPEAIAQIERYKWPGNVRELRNAIEHALVVGDGEWIVPDDLPEALRGVAREEATLAPDGGELVRLPANLAWLERHAIDAALRVTGGNRTRAAALLGINRATLYKKNPV